MLVLVLVLLLVLVLVVLTVLLAFSWRYALRGTDGFDMSDNTCLLDKTTPL